MKQNNLISQIDALENKIAADNAKLNEDKILLQTQLSNPKLWPFLAIGSVAVGYLLIRKKKHKNLFAYFASLSWAATGVFKNIKFVMRALQK